MSQYDDDNDENNQQEGPAAPNLHHTVRELADAKPLTMKRGAFAKSSFKKALGSDKDPSPMARVVDAHQKKISEWSGFMGEMHAALFDPYGAKKLADDEMDAVGAELLGSAETQATWGELKAAARCHSVIAAEAVKELGLAVAAATGIDQMKEDEDSAKTQEELKSEQEAIESMEVDPEDKQGAADKQEALEQIKNAQVKSAARRSALQQKVQAAKQNGTMARMVSKAAGNATKMADAVNALRECGVGGGWSESGSGGGEAEPITLDLIKQAMKMENFSKIIQMVGRMQQAADMQAADALSIGRLAPTGIHKSREMTDLLAVEWALEDVDEDAWLKRYLDGEMMAIERESPEPKHKGDLLIFVDRSGSMGGARIEWARALALAAIQRATQEKRRWIVTMYADSGSSLRTSSSEKGFEHALKTLSVGAGGGTSTDWAIHTVLKKGELGILHDPDVLLITDGDWEDLSEGTQKLLEGLKMRMFVVQLEGYLREIKAATKVWRVADLSIDKAANVLMEVTI